MSEPQPGPAAPQVPVTLAPAHEIIKIPDYGVPGRDVLKQQCFDLRIAVFVHEQRFPLDCEIDEDDATATHFLLRRVPGGEPLGTVRAVQPAGADYYKLSRLAVLKPYHQFRFGRALVLALHAWAVQDAARRGRAGTARVVAHSQIPVKRFYAKYGYEPEGEEFDEDGAPHQKMVVRLPIPV